MGEGPRDSATPYGPATAQLRRFLLRLAAMAPVEESLVVTRFHNASNTAEYRAAERALESSVIRSGREDTRDAVAGPFLQIVQRRPRSPAADSSEGDSSEDDSGEASRLANDEMQLRPLAEPALAALLAIMMRDVLRPAEVERLYAAFDTIIPLNSLE